MIGRVVRSEERRVESWRMRWRICACRGERSRVSSRVWYATVYALAACIVQAWEERPWWIGRRHECVLGWLRDERSAGPLTL
jgi:hypothetical protein